MVLVSELECHPKAGGLLKIQVTGLHLGEEGRMSSEAPIQELVLHGILGVGPMGNEIPGVKSQGHEGLMDGGRGNEGT